MARALHLLEGVGVTAYRVHVRLLVTPEDETDDIDQFTDDMMGHLQELDADADMGGSVESGLFDVWVTVDADEPFEAVLKGGTTIRTAGRAVGGVTKDWPPPTEWPQWIRAVSLNAEPVKDDLVERVPA